MRYVRQMFVCLSEHARKPLHNYVNVASKRYVGMYVCVCVHVDHVNNNLCTATGKFEGRKKTREKLRN